MNDSSTKGFDKGKGVEVVLLVLDTIISHPAIPIMIGFLLASVAVAMLMMMLCFWVGALGFTVEAFLSGCVRGDQAIAISMATTNKKGYDPAIAFLLLQQKLRWRRAMTTIW